jgi:hypothetical protein
MSKIFIFTYPKSGMCSVFVSCELMTTNTLSVADIIARIDEIQALNKITSEAAARSVRSAEAIFPNHGVDGGRATKATAQQCAGSSHVVVV